MPIVKKQLTDILYDRLNQVIHKKHLHDAITVISEFLLEKFTNNESVSVDNFGTFSPYTRPAHTGFNVAKGKLQEVKSFLSVKFRPHDTFLKIIQQRRNKYKKS